MTKKTNRYFALATLTKLLSPPRRLSVSEFADQYRVLSAKASSEPGQWRTSRTPYLREIMDCLSVDSPVSRVAVMKSAQLGVTEVAVNWVGYIMAHIKTAKPTLVVLPTDNLLVRWVHQRLRPMVTNAECLKELIQVSKTRDGSNRLDLIDYPGGLLYLTSAGSASNLKSDSIAYVICDEADEYAWEIGGRGDPLSLIESRQANFPRRKLLIFSTPTLSDSSRIAQEFAQGDQRYYLIRCPQCGHYQSLVWEQLRWTQENNAINAVHYECVNKGCQIFEHEKPALLRERSDKNPNGAYWRPTAEPASKTIRSYSLNALYSPIGLGYSWRQLIDQYIAAQKVEERMKQFTNERLGKVYDSGGNRVTVRHLLQQVTGNKLRVLPRDDLLICCAIDTQDDRLECQIVGFGPLNTWYVIDYQIIKGDPGLPKVWNALADYLNRPLQTQSGFDVAIDGVAIDMQGHFTDQVKAFIGGYMLKKKINTKIMCAIRGITYNRQSVLSRPRRTDFNHKGKLIRHGAVYYEVQTTMAKIRLQHDLASDIERESEERKSHFPSALSTEYFAGLLSETFNPIKKRFEHRRGMTKRNESLDTWCYAYAVAHHPLVGLDKMTDRKFANLAKRRAGDKQKTTAKTPQDTNPLAAPDEQNGNKAKRVRVKWRVKSK
jgi:phage terminase large subunit GpA-like protein